MTESKYLVKKPIYEAGPPGVKGRQIPTMTYMCNDLIPGCNMYLEFGWIWAMPEPKTHIHEHVHDYNELVLHIGSDPDNPEDLGGEIEFVVGDERLSFDSTSAIFIPKGVKHGPVTWKKFRRPHIQMAIVLGGGEFTESAPGGDKIRRHNK